MTTPQDTKLHPSSPERYEEMSRNYLRQAEEELNKGDGAQAAEKVWGGAALALKSFAQQMGWNHRYHNHLRSVAHYLAAEWNRPDWGTTFSSLDNIHTNFYEHQMSVSMLRPHLALAKVFCEEILQLRGVTPPDQGHLTQEQQGDQERHLRILTRQLNDRAAFGEELTGPELEDLPSVQPPHI